MNLKTLAVVAAAALAVAAAVIAARTLLRPDTADTVTVAQGEVQVRVGGPGTVQARVPVTVSARVSAQVVSLHADHGERVKRGQLLAVLDDRDLAAKRAAAVAGRESIERNIAAAEASLAKARADAELARNRQARDAELRRAGFISQSAYDTSALGLKAAEASTDNAAALLAARRAEGRAVAEDARYAETLWSHTRLTAPMDGLVIQRSAEVGTTVAPGAAVFRLVDPATLWVAARIDEALVGRIEVGMPARILLRNGEAHAGRVARISRQSDAATRELEVNVAFDAPPERFAIDQEAEVSILAGTERGPVVPVAALVLREGRQGVMLLREGRKVFQPVRIAASDGKHAVIAEGLDQGAKLAAWTSR
ncbi:MAG TPA: efflux RND transporter periplasmic adaptor subunit [Burkholderiales bacterium]|jgi:RND family efflux transporter MFP subunit|nr:efflux RND transporter periplasmic adaptor subunit [Burkholderiales bacterium]